MKFRFVWGKFGLGFGDSSAVQGMGGLLPASAVASIVATARVRCAPASDHSAPRDSPAARRVVWLDSLLPTRVHCMCESVRPRPSWCGRDRPWAGPRWPQRAQQQKMKGTNCWRLFHFYIFRKHFLQKYIFNFTIYSFVPLSPQRYPVWALYDL